MSNSYSNSSERSPIYPELTLIINFVMAFAGLLISILQISKNTFSFIPKAGKTGVQVISVILIIFSAVLNIYTYLPLFHPSSGLPPVNVPFTVYSDSGYANSNYSAASLTDNTNSLPTDETIDYSWSGNPHNQGTTCIKVVYSNPKYDWVGGEF